MRFLVAWLTLCASALAGCASHAIRFDGHSYRPVAVPGAVVESRTLPRGSHAIGWLSVRCTPQTGWGSFDDVALIDLDCTEQRARHMLREAAAENGGDALVGVACDARTGVQCRALVARTAPWFRPPMPAAAGDVRGARGANVLVEFAPELDRAPGPPRAEQAVRDVPAFPPSHVLVGNVATRCEDCAELAARDALRIAVGRLGATDAVSVRCQAFGRGHRCAGSAAIAEREPDPAPR